MLSPVNAGRPLPCDLLGWERVIPLSSQPALSGAQAFKDTGEAQLDQMSACPVSQRAPPAASGKPLAAREATPSWPPAPLQLAFRDRRQPNLEGSLK